MQNDMKIFRILLSSELNKRKGCPYLDSNENIGSRPSDCTIIENSKMADQSIHDKKKHSEEDLCLVVQTGTSQPVQTHKKSLQVYVTQDHPDEFWAFEVMKDVPMNKKEMIELLYDYVMAIQDEQC
jgi:hypothetical protein